MKCFLYLDCRTWTLLLALATIYTLHLPIACAANPDPNDLIERLVNPQTSSQAYRELSAMGDRGIPLAIAGLESPSKEVRRNLALLLGDIRTDKAIAPLVKMAQSKDSSDSSSALNALGKIGGPEAAEAIIAAFPRLHPSGQADFCLVLSAIGDNRAIEPLIKVLTSRNSENSKQDGEGISNVRARQASAEALGKFRDPRSRNALVIAIKDDPDWDVYHAARIALYQMDGEIYGRYDELYASVALTVTKEPEPDGGAEEFIRNWHKDNPNYKGSWGGPRLEDYASKVDIERARNAVVKTGMTWKLDHRAGGVVELLMKYLCNRKITVDHKNNAKALLIRIGKPAIPALENGVKRGDMVLVQNCQQCIEAINNMPSSQPQQAQWPMDPKGESMTLGESGQTFTK
jgi:HEAT repeat protein